MIEKIGYISDIGNEREHNDDCTIATNNVFNQTLLIVCDGLGGYENGAFASNIVLETILNQFNETDFSDYGFEKIRTWFIKCINNAQQLINNEVLLSAKNYNMGTTLVATIVINNKAFTINIGDSRAFLISEDNVIQITKDHNLYEMLLAKNADEKMFLKYKKDLFSLTQFIGRTSHVVITYDLFETNLKSNDILLLTSDGFHNHYDINDFKDKILEKQDLKRIIDEAIQAGSKDNLSFAYKIIE